MAAQNAPNDEVKSKTILGMIMLEDLSSFDLDTLITDYNENNDQHIVEPIGDNSALVFRIDEELVMISHIDFPIPSSDLKFVAKYAYNWVSSLKDLRVS